MPSPLEIKQLAVEFLRNPKKSARAILGILRPSSIKRTVVARRKILLTAGLLFLATTLFFHKDSQLDASVERTQLLIHTDRFSFAPDSPVAFYAAGGRVHLHSFIQSVVIFDALSSKSVYQRAGLQVAITPGICQSYRGRGCDFAKVFTLSAGVLKPGLYKVEFGMGPGGKSELAWFMIHPAPEESNPESVALVFPSMTWQAYNKSGGANLYRPKRNPKYVSWRRPIVKNNPNRYSPEHLVVVPRILDEKKISYLMMDDLDLHSFPRLLDNVRLLIFLFHNEYWTHEMRENVEAYLSRGGRVLVLGGNICWWKIRLEGDDIMVDKRGRHYLPDVRQRTGQWMSKAVRNPCEKLFGLTYHGAGYPLKRKFPGYEDLPDDALVRRIEYDRSGGMRVLNEGHPIFTETGLRNGDYFGDAVSLVKVELDGIPLQSNGQPDFKQFPRAPRNLVPLASAFAEKSGKVRRIIVMAEVNHKGGGRLLHLGSMGWPGALKKGDPQVERIFWNAMNYLLLPPS